MFLCFHSSLRSSEAGDGHTIGRAACVVQAEFGAELHAGRLTAVLTADTCADVGTDGTAFFNGHLHQLTDTVLVEHLNGSTCRIFFSR